MDKHILICEDNVENILTGIYKAFEYCKQGYSIDNIGIIICENNQYETEFFTEGKESGEGLFSKYVKLNNKSYLLGRRRKRDAEIDLLQAH